MAKKIKGILRIETGLELPSYTTGQIGDLQTAGGLAPGFTVFNSSTGRTETYADIGGGLEFNAVAVQAEVTASVDNKVGIAGDTMTGTLTLDPAQQTLSNHAATLGQVSTAAASATDSSKVLKAGDDMVSAANLTFSGGGNVLGLPAVPVAGGAASKEYVDDQLTAAGNASTVSSLTDTTITGPASGDFLRYDFTSSKWVDTQLIEGDIPTLTAYALAAQGDLADTALQRAGDSLDANANLTFSGTGEVLGLPAVPTVDGAAASKKYVDDQITAGTAHNLDALTDVTITGDTSGDTLVSNGSGLYVNRQLVAADIFDGATAFATGSEGDLATSAVQPTDSVGVLSNVTLTTEGDGDFLRHNGTVFVNVGLVAADIPAGSTHYATAAQGLTADSALQVITGESIKSLSDVFTTMAPNDGEALVYDTTNGWQAEALPTGVTTIAGLSDVTVATPALDDLLFSDASGNYANRQLVAGDIPVLAYASTSQGAKADAAAVLASGVEQFTDVDLTSKVDGNVLVWATDKFISQAPAATNLTNYVTLDGAETITGVKTFSGAGNRAVFNSTTDEVPVLSIARNSAVISTIDVDGSTTLFKTTGAGFISLNSNETHIAGANSASVSAGLSDTTVQGPSTTTTNAKLVLTDANAVLFNKGGGVGRSQIDLAVASANVQFLSGALGLERSTNYNDSNITTKFIGTASASDNSTLTQSRFGLDFNVSTVGDLLSTQFKIDETAQTFDLKIDSVDLVGYDAAGNATLDFGVKATSPATIDADGGTTLVTKAYILGKITAATGASGTNDLTDVDTVTTTLATGHGLFYDGSNFVNRAVAQADVTNLVTDLAAKAVDVEVVHLTGDETIGGIKTFSTSVIVQGDLTVSGTTTTVDTTNLAITDNIITVNDGETNANGVTQNGSTAGISVDRGATIADNAQLLFNETSNKWEIGTVAVMKDIATEAYVDATSYVESFITTDWVTTGSPETFTVTAGTHGLDTTFKIYHVTVMEGTDVVDIETEINASGDVIIKTTGAVFAGMIRISL